MQHNSFTTYSQGLRNVLTNQVGVAAAGVDVQKPHFFRAVWDTGATATVVTKRVVDECGLKQTGITEMHGVHASEKRPTYLVDVFLPNQVQVANLKVAEARLTGNADILVGMDIIGMGDLAVSSYQGKTSFSFRIPSVGRVDFLPPKARPNNSAGARSPRKTGRNEPCPCGSGLKYKKCCGNSTST